MGTGILSELTDICGVYTGHSASQGNSCTGFTRQTGTRDAGPNARIRILHFENAFGNVHTAEYCLDSMINLVLIMVRSARPDADKLARLTETGAAYPAEHDAAREDVAGSKASLGKKLCNGAIVYSNGNAAMHSVRAGRRQNLPHF